MTVHFAGWKLKHVEATSSKASRTLGFMRRNFRDCNKSVREQAYTTMVQPTLEYASAAWDPYASDQINKFDKVPWTPPVLWRLLPQSEAGSILVWYVGRMIVCMLLYWCDVVSVCWHLWFWNHSAGPYMMIPEYRLSHALPYTSLWVYDFFGAPLDAPIPTTLS
jgi:hypothetical protein